MIDKSCLLIGNSRWHWAFNTNAGWDFIHTQPNPQKLLQLERHIFNWAAVGKIPKNVNLDPNKNINIQHIPFKNLPEWLGIDRALGAWGASLRANQIGLNDKYLLVADAGTIFSLTRIKNMELFAGGQLVPGMKLQLEAMARGAKNLKNPGINQSFVETYPFSTNAAMQKGSFQAILGTILEAQRDTKAPIWLCGGDSGLFIQELKNHHLKVFHCPDLVLEGMINIQSKLN